MENINEYCSDIDELEKKAGEWKGKRMDAPEIEMHGGIVMMKGKESLRDSWQAPRLVAFSNEEARPGYATKKAHEYEDEPHVLKSKVKELARLITASQNLCAYTGAGISTSSGIGDYASKAKETVALQKKRLKNPYLAKPTLAHRVITALYHSGNLKRWVQQNHDGLPQKAGLPQEALNEIHGAWFDPSNPVVPMSGSLRGDLFDDLQKWTKKADLCMALGTSLCGMNADQLVTKTAHRAMSAWDKRIKKSAQKSLGSVIVSLQQTQYDNICTLRIYAKLDVVMALLAKEMGLTIDTHMYEPNVPKELIVRPDVFIVPYDENGNLSKNTKTHWNLMKGAKIKVTDGPGTGYEGIVSGKNEDGHYICTLPNQREGSISQGKVLSKYMLGSWWVESAINGNAPKLPVVNINEIKT